MSTLLSAKIKAALIAGTLDITITFIYVLIKTGKFIPFDILKFVASGVFGKRAGESGGIMIFAGLIIHYSIAFIFTFFFFWLFPKVKAASANKIVTAIVYGVFVWVVMNLIVLPFTNVAPRQFNMLNAVINIVILIVSIGVPLSFIANSFYKHRQTSVTTAVTTLH